ncbi:carbohydrate ABC transporter permease [uncultured Acetatifactor sp.]|jgi:putative aldouronate transport system permease protein|uniref:carbohydrate ABC transporter permease n=1 Tax=uncultured Acetatifactor sp. TaxID=1671927 RepID=UPI0026356349|nr:carbohydrate ABC transporter permease [uncultured Acetatifactor sp.]MCI8696137.1 carbohydrate ABC transporter permease [Lachnospiraceae bacterium]
MRSRLTISRIIIIFILVLFALFCFYPLWYTLIVSFSNNAAVSAGKVWLLPSGLNTESYKKLLADTRFFTSFGVSVIRTALGCSLNMLLLVLTAYPLCLPENRFRRGKAYIWFFVANMLFSGGMIPMYVVIRNLKLLNSIWALILPGALPIYNMVLLINFFRNVPYELNEAATIDGANPLQILFRVYIPVSMPSLACLLLFAFVGHWNAYFDGLLYINDLNRQPLQTYIYQISAVLDPQTMTPEQLREASKLSDLTLNSAKVVIAMLPILALYPFLQKYFVTGMTLGSVKG